MKMKSNKAIRARFGPEIKFEVEPRTAGPLRGDPENQLERLKAALLRRSLPEILDGPAKNRARRAANEAAALAWVTPYPLFFFPGLFEEKLLEALRHAERQEQVRRATRELLGV